MASFMTNLGMSLAEANPIANSIIARYRRDHTQPDPTWKDMDSVYAQSQNPIQTPQLPQPAIGRNPGDPFSATANVDEANAAIGNQNQWNQPSQPSQSSPSSGGFLSTLGGLFGLERGAIVTSPTVARIGENGPEAVVPLTPRAGNRLQPDLLEGHIQPKGVPGMRLSRYRSFNRFARGGQSA